MDKAAPVSSHIVRNQLRSIVLLGVLFAGFYVVSFAGVLVYTAASSFGLSRSSAIFTATMKLAGGKEIEAAIDRQRGREADANSETNSSAPNAKLPQSISGKINYVLLHSVQTFKRVAPYATGAALVWLIIGVLLNHALISGVMRARRAAPGRDDRVLRLVEGLCRRNNLAMPKVAVIETPECNAYASGMSASQYTVTVTKGLMARLNDNELEAVIAHELAHIRNHDVRLMVIAAVIAGIVPFALEALFRTFFYSAASVDEEDVASGGAVRIGIVVLAFALVLVVWFLSQLGQLALSRSREYLADAGGVALTGNPDALISALKKISGHSELSGAPASVMQMCIDNPRAGLMNLFSTHPATEDRVAALERLPKRQIVRPAREARGSIALQNATRAQFGVRRG